MRRGEHPADIRKGRIVVPHLGGKRSGQCYVYERITIERIDYLVGLTMYLHQGGPSELDVRSIVRERWDDFDGTKEGLRNLERIDTEGEGRSRGRN